MKARLLVLLLVCLLGLAEFTSAHVFYYADEVDYRNNVAYALHHPFDGVDPDTVGDFDDYACISLDDYNRFARADQYDADEPLRASTATRDDLKRLRRENQLRIINEDPYDSLDRNDIDDDDDWNCYTLRDYNSKAREDPYDNRRAIDFTHFDDLYEVKKIGTYRYNDFYAIPDDFTYFNLQYTVSRPPYDEPYDFRRTQYPLYGYGVVHREDY